MMDQGFGLHPEAFEDLEEIRANLASTSPARANWAISGIFSAIRRVLVPFPYSGHRRPDLTSRPLRFHVALNQYLIAYTPDESQLWIVAVVDGRRNPRVVAAMLRGREE